MRALDLNECADQALLLLDDEWDGDSNGERIRYTLFHNNLFKSLLSHINSKYIDAKSHPTKIFQNLTLLTECYQRKGVYIYFLLFCYIDMFLVI